MITHISIKDFAIIENTEIDFESGLNIITGETGAGKSIVIEAISLALGSRADTTFVRAGKEKAVIQLAAFIAAGEIVVTREISSAGKSVCRINGELATLAQLNQLCKKIADVHGQYDHQSLLNPENHIGLLDTYYNKNIYPLKELVVSDFLKYTDVKNKLGALLSTYEENLRKRDFMRFELDEIKGAKLFLNEDAGLTNEIYILQNSEKIYQSLSAAYEISRGESPAALDGLQSSLKMLQDVSGYSEKISALTDGFSDAYYKLEDLCGEIRDFRDKISFSQEDLDNALSRLDFIESLKRKYGGSIEKILKHGETIEEQLSRIENIDETKEALTKELGLSEGALNESSEKLSALRKAGAKELEQKILYELKELNFNDALLSIDFTKESGYTSNGFDKVEFLLSANKGEPLKPLSKIASGGEMSRIMLAFKKIIAAYDEIPTMIFDEIDSGISGAAASVVGKKLCQIAENHQIICITHLPHIAAFGRHNYKIEKDSDESMTYTTVSKLNNEEKIMEIARLLGGANVTEKTIDSARELIELSIQL